MSNKEIAITDESSSSLIERGDLKKKIQKISVYIKRAQNRIQELNKTLIKKPEVDRSVIQQGLSYYQLSDNISKEV